MLIKQKSLIVAITSSFIISMVLILTLVSYVMYIELNAEKAKRTYQDMLEKVNAKVYSKHLQIIKLDAKWERQGPLQGNPLIEGVVKNTGTRVITNMLLKVQFLDKDGAIVYEVVFHSNEPSFGTHSLTSVAIPYIAGPSKIFLNPDESLAFKKILTDCPREISLKIEKGAGFGKDTGRWSGKLTCETVAIEFK